MQETNETGKTLDMTMAEPIQYDEMPRDADNQHPDFCFLSKKEILNNFCPLPNLPAQNPLIHNPPDRPKCRIIHPMFPHADPCP
jgi:hypothetical protein